MGRASPRLVRCTGPSTGGIRQSVVAGRTPRGWQRFGFELGLGWRTRITNPSPLIAATAVAFLSPGPITAVAAGAAFGLTRGAALVATVRTLRVPPETISAGIGIALAATATMSSL
jgi:hypothetical protein